MEKHYYEVTELNTRRISYKDPVLDILYGSDYKRHRCKTLEEAREISAALENAGIHTNIANVREVS